MDEFARHYWWLIFPLMWFVFGIFGMALAHRRDRDAMDLMKTYAEKGRDPSEIAQVLGRRPGDWSGDWGGGWWARRAWRYTPYWAWRRAIMAGCVAIGFWLAAYYADWPDWGWPGFSVVAIIMSVIAAGALINAVLASVFSARSPRP